MSKGSGRRPTDNKKFVDNYDRIFNNKNKDKNGDITNTTDIKKASRKRRISSRNNSRKVERICED